MAIAFKPMMLGFTYFCVCMPIPVVAQNLATGAGLEVPLARIVSGLIICLLVVFAVVLLMRSNRMRENFKGSSNEGNRPSLALWNMIGLQAVLKENFENAQGEIRVLESRKLTPTADICRLSVDGETIVLVISQGAISVLYRQSTHEKVTASKYGHEIGGTL